MNKALFSSFIAILLVSYACKHEPQYAVKPSVDSFGNFPKEVGRIIVTKCATAGCHNSLSYEYAAGLRLDTWEHLFKGGVSGAVIIPFSPENSSLLFFINPDSSLGPTAQPRMPLNSSLTAAEYQLIRQWVIDGAPDKDGNLPFSSNADTRQKVYITNQGCDLVGVVDAASKVIMRYIPVGASNQIESPHYIRIASDGFGYVSFTAGTKIQKFDTRTDAVVGEAEIGPGSWNAFHLSDDGKKLLLGDFSGSGRLLFINTQTMQVELLLNNIGLVYPHGIASNKAFNTFFVTSQYGNIVYRISLINGNLTTKQISIDNNPPSNTPSRDPHEIIMLSDESKYFVTCDNSNEVRVMDAVADTVLNAINVGIYPQTMALSKNKPYLFVTCSEDNSTLAGFKGSVYVINYLTHEVVKKIDGQFYQPHAISVDDENGLVYIASRNINPSGPAPHHTSSCGGRNGYYTVYDLNTLEKLPKRYEMSVDPYSSDSRF